MRKRETTLKLYDRLCNIFDMHWRGRLKRRGKWKYSIFMLSIFPVFPKRSERRRAWRQKAGVVGKMGHGIRDEARRSSTKLTVIRANRASQRLVSYMYGGHRPGIRRAFLETAPPQLRHARHHFYFARRSVRAGSVANCRFVSPHGDESGS